MTLDPATFTCDDTGIFTVRVLPTTHLVTVLAGAPGFDYFVSDLTPVPYGAQSTLEFALSLASGGVVELALRRSNPDFRPIVFHDERPVPMPAFGSWARDWREEGPTGSDLIVASDMPPGHYRLCTADILQYLRLLSRASTDDLDCTEATLARGGHVRLGPLSD